MNDSNGFAGVLLLMVAALSGWTSAPVDNTPAAPERVTVVQVPGPERVVTKVELVTDPASALEAERLRGLLAAAQARVAALEANLAQRPADPGPEATAAACSEGAGYPAAAGRRRLLGRRLR